MLPFLMKEVKFARYRTLKCSRISNYLVLTLPTEYSINRDDSNPRKLELVFVSLYSPNYQSCTVFLTSFVDIISIILAGRIAAWYTCQLFLRYKREIFILRVLVFLKTTRSFPKVPEEVRSLPKKS